MTYVAIQNTYDEVHLALCSDKTIQAKIRINKIDANAQCIPALDTLLKNQKLSIDDIEFIIANCGPGPFTTLRVVLATVNGIHAASGIPLIGVDALDALIQEHASPSHPTIALLNAFNQDVYYAINAGAKGCQNIITLINELAIKYPQQPLYFIGNGTRMHHALIAATFGDYAHIPNPLPETCSLNQIQRMGFEAWQQGKACPPELAESEGPDKRRRGQRTPLVPHYIKSAKPTPLL